MGFILSIRRVGYGLELVRTLFIFMSFLTSLVRLILPYLHISTTPRTQDWQIYVDQSRPSLDRGGDAIFDAFFSLCDTSGENFDNDGNEAVEVQVIPALLPKPASGGKGPWIRCIWNTNNKKNLVRPSPNLDVSNVDSVEKVYRVLSTHLGVKVRVIFVPKKFRF